MYRTKPAAWGGGSGRETKQGPHAGKQQEENNKEETKDKRNGETKEYD